MMQKFLVIPALAFFLSGSTVVVTPQWRESYPRICIFPSDGLEEPEPCNQFYRVSYHRTESGESYTIYKYKWTGVDGREVVYSPEIGGFGVGIFTIGTLFDSHYDGGRTFKPAVSHALHRDKTVIGVPNEGYVFSVCSQQIEGEIYNCE